jgi:carbon monoxide dehydrogenase subunit G
MTMATFALSKKIDAPPAAVFNVFSDLANAAGRIKAITKIEVIPPGPVGVGTRFKETRMMFGKECTEEMEITAFDPGHSYEVTGHTCGVDICTVFHFSPEGDGTRVDVDHRTRATSFFGKLMKPMGFLMKGLLKKCIDQDLEDLKKVAEGAAMPLASGGR